MSMQSIIYQRSDLKELSTPTPLFPSKTNSEMEVYPFAIFQFLVLNTAGFLLPQLLYFLLIDSCYIATFFFRKLNLMIDHFLPIF